MQARLCRDGSTGAALKARLCRLYRHAFTGTPLQTSLQTHLVQARLYKDGSRDTVLQARLYSHGYRGAALQARQEPH